MLSSVSLVVNTDLTTPSVDRGGYATAWRPSESIMSSKANKKQIVSVVVKDKKSNRKRKRNNSKKVKNMETQMIVSRPLNYVDSEGHAVKPRKSRKQKTVNPRGVKLSPCALKYAICISDPWNPKAQGACVPSFPARNSYKHCSYTRFTLTGNSSGFAYVLISPCLANTRSYYYASSSSFVGSGTLTLTMAGTGSVLTPGTNAVFMSSLPASDGDLAPNGYTNSVASGRILSVGVSCQYTGSAANAAGTLGFFVDPSHGNLANLTTATLKSRMETIVRRVTQAKNFFSAAAVSEIETDYATTQYSAFGAGSGNLRMASMYPWSNAEYSDVASFATYENGGCPMALWIEGGVNGASYEIEIIQHCEYIGSKFEGRLTPSVADPVGYQTINSAAQRVQQNQSTSRDMTFGQSFMAALKDVAQEALPVAASVIKSQLRGGVSQYPTLEF